MGYHQRLARIPKTTDVSGLSFENIKEQCEDDFFLTKLNGYEELIYLGDIKDITGTPFFDFNIKDYGYEFSILTKDDLKSIIEQYYLHVQTEFTKLKELLSPALWAWSNLDLDEDEKSSLEEYSFTDDECLSSYIPYSEDGCCCCDDTDINGCHSIESVEVSIVDEDGKIIHLNLG